MGRSNHRHSGKQQSNNNQHPHYAVSIWNSSSAFNPWSLARKAGKGKLSHESSLNRTWELSTRTLEAFFVAGSSTKLQARKRLSSDAIHRFDDMWAAAMDPQDTKHRQHQKSSDGGEIDGQAMRPTMEPQASVSSDDGSDNDGDDSDGDDSDGDNDDDDNDDDDDSDGDDDDWDTGSLITSNRHYARGLSITNTDRSWVDRLCKLVTAAYNDWSDWTAAAREPGSTRPSHRKKPSRKRPREERRETSGPQHSRKKSNEQRKRSKRTAEDMEGDSLNNDDSDGNDGDGDGGGREALPASSDDSKRKFACPFYKSNNKRYAECLRFRFTRVSDVKQHLRRVHMRPLFCYLCGEEFTLQDENGLEAHARALDCEKKDFEKPDGITQGQIKWLGYRGPKGSTLIDQWYLGIWDVVFPGKARPDTPFVLTAADEVRQDLVSRFESKWPEFMSEYFESHPQSISSNGVAPLDIEQVSKLFTTMQLELLNRLVLESMQTDDKGNTPYEDVESTITTNQEAVLQHASPLTTTAAGDVATPDDSIEVDAEAEPFRGNTTQYLFDLAQENPATLGGGTVEAESFNSYASEQTMGHNHGAQDSDLQEYEPSELFDDAWLQYP